MNVFLQGSSAAAATAGILLLTRARQLGFRASVGIVGDPTDVVAVRGPALCYAPVLASCGVGREHGQGAVVVVPGPPGEPLLATVTPHGEGGWFEVGRAGSGAHPAARAFVRLLNDPRPDARRLAGLLREGFRALGLSTDPAVLDVLCGADVDPLTRLAIALRAGRALSGGRGEPLQRFLTGATTADPLPPPDRWSTPWPDVDWLLASLHEPARAAVSAAVALARRLADGDGDRDQALSAQLLYHLSVLVQLPPQSILPPLGAAEDSVATQLGAALVADGDDDANRQLSATFLFLGGRYVADAAHAVDLGSSPPPSGRVALWSWFGTEVRRGRKLADSLWPNLIDPPC